MNIIKQSILKNKTERFDEESLKDILSKIEVVNMKNGPINVLDPCLGLGESLDQIKHYFQTNYQVETFGVEFDDEVFQNITHSPDYCIQEDAFSIRTSEDFNVVLLNPMNSETSDERFVMKMLRHLSNKTTNVFAPNALLICKLPFHSLRPTLPTLFERFHDVNILRLNDEDDLVVIANFGKLPQEERAVQIKKTRDLIGEGLLSFPSLKDFDEPLYVYSNSGEVELFRAGKMHPLEIKADLLDSVSFSDFKNKIDFDDKKDVMKRPILPLKPTHAGVAIASGAVGGNLGTHIVTGITKQKKVVTNVDSQDEIERERHSLFYTSVVRVFSNEGIFELE